MSLTIKRNRDDTRSRVRNKKRSSRKVVEITIHTRMTIKIIRRFLEGPYWIGLTENCSIKLRRLSPPRTRSSRSVRRRSPSWWALPRNGLCSPQTRIPSQKVRDKKKKLHRHALCNKKFPRYRQLSWWFLECRAAYVSTHCRVTWL